MRIRLGEQLRDARRRGLFITGTDTGVGKTEVACALLRAARRLGAKAVGMKPVAAGARRVRSGWVNTDVRDLIEASAVRVPKRLCNPYLFAAPIAPHLAAESARIRIDLQRLSFAYKELARRADAVIVEGAGGFLVPLNERAHMGDWVQRLRLPVVLVVGMRLGCLSHALLTAEAIERRGLHLAGWVANRVDPAMRRYADNVRALRERLPAPLWAEIPHLANKQTRHAAIDRALARAPLPHWLAAVPSNNGRKA
jgi:dethiobiotin synthetase